MTCFDNESTAAWIGLIAVMTTAVILIILWARGDMPTIDATNFTLVYVYGLCAGIFIGYNWRRR